MRKTASLSLVILLAVFCLTADASELKTRPRIGLVLGGGGARGAAHIGVLRVLEANNIPIDYIAGTSMGAIVGGLYASGMSPAEIEELFEETDWKDLFSDKPSNKDLSFRHKQDQRRLIDFEVGIKNWKIALPRGLIAGQKLNFLLQSKTLQTTDVNSFDNLPIAFRAIATDIETGEMVVLDKGNLAETIRASMSVPAVFAPVEIDGHLLVDGGIANNLPVDIVKQMGADIVIAVKVGTPLSSLDELKSVIDISAQVIAIMTSQNIKKQIELLGNKDILVEPNLEGYSSSDFIKTSQIVKIGEKATQPFESKLKEYTLPSREYKKYLSRQRKNVLKPTRLDFVDIHDTTRVDIKRIKTRLRTKPGDTLNLKILKKDLMDVYEIGDFEQVNFRLISKKDRKGLLVDTKEKAWGPNYLRFGLNITENFEGDSYYNLILNYTLTQLNKLGAEWENDIQIGRNRHVLSELYQPLDYKERFFVAPHFLYEHDISDVYSGGNRLARYRVRTLGGGADLGMNFGTIAEARFGVFTGKAKAGPIVGSPYLPKFNVDIGAMMGSFLVDQIDNWHFPKKGFAGEARVFMARPGLNSDENYDKFHVETLNAATLGRHTFLASAEYGTNFGKTIPFYDEFTLGGFLALSGYRKDELRGQHLTMGRLLYYYRLFDVSSGWADGIYIGGAFEAGNVWTRRSNIKLDDFLLGGCTFIGFDTILGPLYLGYGRTEKNDEGKYYLYLGQTF